VLGKAGLLNIVAVSAYVLLILFLLVVSVGYDEGASNWRLGPIAAETIVLALLLFLPFLLPRRCRSRSSPARPPSSSARCTSGSSARRKRSPSSPTRPIC